MTSAYRLAFISGIAGAALFAAPAILAGIGLILSVLAPVPGLVSGLAYGLRPAVLSIVTSAILLTGLLGFKVALVFVLTHGLVIGLLSHLALLHREQPTGESAGGAPSVEWYPLGRLVAWTVGLASLVASALLLLQDIDMTELLAELTRRVETEFVSQLDVATRAELGPDFAARTAGYIVTFLPGGLSVAWMLVSLMGLWLAALLDRRLGILGRPWPDIPSMELPGLLTVTFAISLIGSFLAGVPGLIAIAFAAAHMAAFAAQGLATIHFLSRGRPARALLILAVYGGLAVAGPIIGIAMVMLGLLEPMLGLRAKSRAGPGRAPPPA